MTRKTKYRGLCLTCRNDPTCKLPRVSSIPVEQCEEFVSCRPGTSKPADKEPSVTTGGKKIATTAVETAMEMGLCANCESRETCTFPEARKGIQHCEEYR